MFKATPQDLDLKPVVVLSEEGKRLTCFPIGLDGIDPGLASSLRKMRLFHQSQVLHLELLLRPEHQLSKEQGANTFGHALSQLVGGREGGLKKEGKILQASELFEKAAEIEEARVAAVEQLKGEVKEQEDEDDAFGAKPLITPKKVVSVPTAAASSITGSTVASTKKSASKAAASRAKRKAAVFDDDEEDREMEDFSDAGTGVSTPGLADMTSLLAHDPEMGKVAQKHAAIVGYEVSCFRSLDVKRYLREAKLGKALQGVRT